MKSSYNKVLLSVFIVALMAVLGLCLNKESVKADNGFPLELNETCENLPEDFFINQHESNEIYSRFFEYLRETHGVTFDDNIYTVNGVRAEYFPAYFGGAYINTEGKLVVQIVDSFYSEEFRNSIWYQEFVSIVGSENFYCHAVEHSYAELVDAISSVSLGELSSEISAAGFSIVEAGINDYENAVEVGVGSQAAYDFFVENAQTDVYNVSIVDYVPQDCIGLYPGEGITTTSTGTYTFSVACRAKKHYPDGSYDIGFLTCEHGFSGTSNVYLNTGGGTNTLIGVSYSSDQKYGNKADVAFITTNSNTTLYNTVYMSTTTINATYLTSMGSVAYKRGETTGVTYGDVLDSSFTVTVGGVTFTDLVKTKFTAAPGDSGGIVYAPPSATNYADVLGIMKGIGSSYSFFTKMYNDLAALQTGPIYFTLY